MPFLINTVALFYNFGKSWKSDPGIIKASEEQKKKVKTPAARWTYYAVMMLSAVSASNLAV